MKYIGLVAIGVVIGLIISMLVLLVYQKEEIVSKNDSEINTQTEVDSTENNWHVYKTRSGVEFKYPESINGKPTEKPNDGRNELNILLSFIPYGKPEREIAKGEDPWRLIQPAILNKIAVEVKGFDEFASEPPKTEYEKQPFLFKASTGADKADQLYYDSEKNNWDRLAEDGTRTPVPWEEVLQCDKPLILKEFNDVIACPYSWQAYESRGDGYKIIARDQRLYINVGHYWGENFPEEIKQEVVKENEVIKIVLKKIVESITSR